MTETVTKTETGRHTQRDGERQRERDTETERQRDRDKQAGSQTMACYKLEQNCFNISLLVLVFCSHRSAKLHQQIMSAYTHRGTAGDMPDIYRGTLGGRGAGGGGGGRLGGGSNSAPREPTCKEDPPPPPHPPAGQRIDLLSLIQTALRWRREGGGGGWSGVGGGGGGWGWGVGRIPSSSSVRCLLTSCAN